MKTPEEYLEEFTMDISTEGDMSSPHKAVDMIELIKKVQKDAYNQALEDVAEKQEPIYNDCADVDYYVLVETILELKK
jgi:hypothetical protein